MVLWSTAPWPLNLHLDSEWRGPKCTLAADPLAAVSDLISPKTAVREAESDGVEGN